MNKKIISLIGVFLSIGLLSVVTYSYLVPVITNKVDYNLTYLDPDPNNVTTTPTLRATVIRRQDSNGNFHSEITYLSPDDNRVKDLYGIVGQGVYSNIVDENEQESLMFTSLYESFDPLSTTEVTNLSGYLGTDTVCGYTTYIYTSPGMTTYYSPTLNMDLKYIFSSGTTITCTEVNIDTNETITLPDLEVTSYDEFHSHNVEFFTNELIDETEFNYRESFIPQ